MNRDLAISKLESAAARLRYYRTLSQSEVGIDPATITLILLVIEALLQWWLSHRTGVLARLAGIVGPGRFVVNSTERVLAWVDSSPGVPAASDIARLSSMLGSIDDSPSV